MDRSIYAYLIGVQHAQRMGEKYLEYAKMQNWVQMALLYNAFMAKLEDYPHYSRSTLFGTFNRAASMN